MQSMFHRNRTFMVFGLPDKKSYDDDISLASLCAERLGEEPVVTTGKPKLILSQEWYKRRQDGKLFKTVKSSPGRMEIQSDCEKEFDTIIIDSNGGWKSISPTSHENYCRVPQVR